ncbi:MAG: hypothetical protein SPL54_00475, partial [Lachnospiraceae bacterium]|nr:hypothetical protein [Lachnospiraceae bacterium]
MASVTYRLPNELQMAELIYQQTKVRYLQEAANSKLSALEQELAARFAAQRNGKVFATKIWKFASNQASAGVRMRDSMGLTCVPSTDSVEGQDDFEDASPIFQWYRCNYT